MSYGDVRQNRTATIVAVVGVHAALGYALLTGLATDVVKRVVSGPTIIYDVPPVEPPPPDPLPKPKTDTVAKTVSETIAAPIPKVPPLDAGFTVTSIEDKPGPIVEATPDVAPEPPAQPPAVSLARGASPRGNQGDWFPPDSYPASAQRAGAEGLVSVRVGVGANGRITDCTVIGSSGNAALDDATCRLARRNGRFEPALNVEGQPVPSSATLRNVRWRLTE